MADSLAEVLRDLHAKDYPAKPTWLQSIFGLPPGKKVPEVYLKATGSVHPMIRLGGMLESAEFAVFVHTTAAEVLGARCLPEDGRRTGKGARKAAVSRPSVPPERYTALADDLEGEVVAEFRVAIQKRGRGAFLDPEESRVSASREGNLLPIAVDDCFRLSVSVRPKAHVYLVWIDSIGATTPLFPWSPEHGWDDPTAESRNQPRAELVLPDGIADLLKPGAVLESFGKAGAETFVLLAHRHRLELLDVRRWFEGLPAPATPPAPIPFRDPGRVERLPLRRELPKPGVTDPADETAPPVRQARVGRRKSADRLEELLGRLNQSRHFRVDEALALIVPSYGEESPRSQGATL